MHSFHSVKIKAATYLVADLKTESFSDHDMPAGSKFLVKNFLDHLCTLKISILIIFFKVSLVCVYCIAEESNIMMELKNVISILKYKKRFYVSFQ